jgi:phage protein D
MSRPFSGVFVSLVIGGKSYTMEDLHAFRITVTDNEEGDNEVQIFCSDKDYAVTDNKLAQLGQSLSIRWGYEGTESGSERSGYVITKPSTNYTTDGVVVTLTATTKSVLMSARRPQKSYGKSTLKSIIQDIANRNKLDCEITGTVCDVVLDSSSQGKLSDREYLRLLSDRFGFVATFQDSKLLCAARSFDQKSTLVFKYNKGEEGDIISATVTHTHNKDTGAGEMVQVHSSDPSKKTDTKTQVTVNTIKTFDLGQVNPSAHSGTLYEVGGVTSESIRGAMETARQQQTGVVGQVVAKVESTAGGKMSKLLGVSDVQWTPEDVKDIQSLPPTSEAAIKAITTSTALNSKHRKAEMTVEVEGEPRLTVRQVIEIAGLAKRDNGKWYTIKVVHKIDDANGYTCEMELTRSGHNLKGAGIDNPNTNTNVTDKSKIPPPSVEVSTKVDLDTRKVWLDSEQVQPPRWRETYKP